MNTIILKFQNLSMSVKKIAIFLLLVNLITGCADSKYSQCQKIVKIANEMAKETKALTKSGQENDMKTWLAAADRIEQTAQDIEKMELTDQSLQEYQKGFAQVYRDYAEATREIIKVWETRDRIAAKAAQEKVRRASKRDRELAQQINTYCKVE